VLFTQPTFLFIFLPTLLALYFLVVAVANRGAGFADLNAANVLLVLASLVFYELGAGRYIWLLCGSIAFNWWMAAAIDRAHGEAAASSSGLPKTLLVGGVTVNILVLGVFKYANFFAGNFGTLSLALGRQPIGIPVLLPLGMSFLTLHSISYLVDVYRRDARAQRTLVDAALYLAFFPPLIAGPVVRYRDFAPQISQRVVGVGNFVYGVRRVVIGLCKKLLIADVVGVMADRVFDMPIDRVGAGTAWFGLLCFTLQIYFALSGYSDMAIGLGRMFGFRLSENFRWPYIAETMQEFWRRWMISLSTWSRDYLSLPIGGDQITADHLFRHVSVVAVFVLYGLWHGTSWNFVIWGLYHGAFIVLERAGLALAIKQLPAPLRHAYLIVVVMIGWVFFRAQSVLAALMFLKVLAGLQTSMVPVFALQPHPGFYFWIALLAGLTASAPLVGSVSRWRVTIDAATVSALVMLFATGIFVWSSIRSLLSSFGHHDGSKPTNLKPKADGPKPKA
jgi:alginate O-acetyltransferase complex protein AlgI